MTYSNDPRALDNDGRNPLEREVYNYALDYVLDFLADMDADELAQCLADGTLNEHADFDTMLDRAPEYLDALDVYYSQTERRGCLGHTWDSTVDVLEKYGYEYLVSEVRMHHSDCEPLLHTCNRLVNWTGAAIMRDVVYECLDEAISQHLAKVQA